MSVAFCPKDGNICQDHKCYLGGCLRAPKRPVRVLCLACYDVVPADGRCGASCRCKDQLDDEPGEG